MEWWQVAITSLVSAIAGSGVVGYVAKSFFESTLQKGADAFRAELGRAGIEHQIRFAHLHTKRAEAIAESYRVLATLRLAVGAYISPAQKLDSADGAERAKEAYGALIKAWEYIPTVEIYFPEATAKKTVSLFEKIHDHVTDFEIKVRSKSLSGDLKVGKDWSGLNESFQQEVSDLLKSLAKDYRELLG
jgi:hypothetical protein